MAREIYSKEDSSNYVRIATQILDSRAWVGGGQKVGYSGVCVWGGVQLMVTEPEVEAVEEEQEQKLKMQQQKRERSSANGLCGKFCLQRLL